MLDLRSQRDPNSVSDSPSKSILGAEQKAWMKEGLLRATATWKFIMSTVPFNPTSKRSDSWAAFQTERHEIVEFIETNGISNVIIISGDIHSGGALDNGINSGSQSFLLHTQIFLHVPLLQVVSAILLEKTQENGVKASYVE